MEATATPALEPKEYGGRYELESDAFARETAEEAISSIVSMLSYACESSMIETWFDNHLRLPDIFSVRVSVYGFKAEGGKLVPRPEATRFSVGVSHSDCPSHPDTRTLSKTANFGLFEIFKNGVEKDIMVQVRKALAA